jgi:hypothetical protein
MMMRSETETSRVRRKILHDTRTRGTCLTVRRTRRQLHREPTL